MSRLKSYLDRYFGTGVVSAKTERRVELAAIGLFLVLVLQLLVGGMGIALLDEPDPVTPSVAGMDAAGLASVERVSAGQRQEISERPLFSPSRRPARPPVVVEKKKDQPKGNLDNIELLGVFGSGGTAGVIVKVQGSKVRMMLGDKVEGWTLKEVHPDRIIVARSGRKETLLLAQQEVKGRPVSMGKKADASGGAEQSTDGAGQANDKDKSGSSSEPQLSFGGR